MCAANRSRQGRRPDRRPGRGLHPRVVIVVVFIVVLVVEVVEVLVVVEVDLVGVVVLGVVVVSSSSVRRRRSRRRRRRVLEVFFRRLTRGLLLDLPVGLGVVLVLLADRFFGDRRLIGVAVFVLG